eukprot:2754823-Ditylum_brightwellii.AAC.1
MLTGHDILGTGDLGTSIQHEENTNTGLIVTKQYVTNQGPFADITSLKSCMMADVDYNSNARVKLSNPTPKTFEQPTTFKLTECNKLKADQHRRLKFLCPQKLQASIMRSKQQNQFNVLRNGMLQLQARARGVAERSCFMFELTTNHCSFCIKACHYHLPDGADIDSKSNVSCTICIITNKDEDLDDCKKQMY